ncbi:hypothetical protein KSP39_PZI017210 [Platanthera zijinensis]|uniref:Uncharacterized protein n=1 Tax=Platanthera zijinensis TaxID=2320716 RepID=A0AAP0B5X6_9ASPA
MWRELQRIRIPYLDTAGVTDGSRMMMEEDLTARAKRLLEMRCDAQADRAAKSLATVTVAIDGPVSKARRVQRNVEKLDMMKPNSSNHMHYSSVNKNKQRRQLPVVVTRKWEIFDLSLTVRAAAGGGPAGRFAGSRQPRRGSPVRPAAAPVGR